MRGLLLAVVGGALLWLGLAVEHEDEPGAALAAEGEAEAEVRTAAMGPLSAMKPAPSVDPAGGRSPSDRDSVSEAPRGRNDSSDSGAPVSNPTPVGGSAVDAQVQLGGIPARASSAEDAAAAADAVGRVFELQRPDDGGSALALVLLEAWLAQDPAPLQVHLNGATVNEDQRRMTGAFWQALVGSPDLAEDELRRQAEEGGATSAQLELLRAARSIGSGGVVPGPAGRRDPMAFAMRMVLMDSASALAASQGRARDAALLLSDLIHAEIDAPWSPHREALLAWGESLRAVQERHRLSPTGDWPSVTHVVKPNQGVADARKAVLQGNPEIVTCVGLIERVNGLHSPNGGKRFIHPGDRLRVPVDLPNMLVDLDARVAIYRHGQEAVLLWEIGVGQAGKETPIGVFTTGDKLEGPRYPSRELGLVLPTGDPRNPLGTRWIGWYEGGNKTDYGFHGTNEPEGVGGAVSRGCVRMRNEDVEELYELLPMGVPVAIQP